MKKERQGREKPHFLKHTPPKKRDDFSDSEDEDDGGVVPQKTYEDLQRKYRYIKKQKQDLQEELDEFKHK